MTANIAKTLRRRPLRGANGEAISGKRDCRALWARNDNHRTKNPSALFSFRQTSEVFLYLPFVLRGDFFLQGFQDLLPEDLWSLVGVF